MAEVFGVVASGIGIAGVAAQAIDGIRKLQTFCDDVRDAPEEIKYMTNELEVLLSTTAGIEAQIQRNASMCQSLNPTPALRFVNQSVMSLNAVIQKLNTEITQKRMLGSIETAWKKKVLEAHMIKIERSKTSLGLAISAYSTELFLQTTVRTDTRIDQLSMNVATLTTSRQAQLMPVPKPQISDKQQTRCDRRLLVNRDYEHDDPLRRARKGPKPSTSIPVYSFVLILPYWLTQYTLQISVCRVAQNWTLNLKPYRTVSGSELWFTIIEGDFDAVRRLIDSGQATVFDRDEVERTPLHLVASLASIDDAETFLRMARFFIDRGVDINELDRLGFPVVCHLNTGYSSRIFATSSDVWNLEIFRLLMDGIDLDSELFWDNYDSLGDTFSPAFERALERVFPLYTMEYPKSTVAGRLRYTKDRCMDLVSPRDLAIYLDFESLEAAYSTLEDRLRPDLLRVALRQWVYSLAWSEQATLCEEWGNILQSLFAAGARLEWLCSGGTEEVKGGSESVGSEDKARAEVIRSVGQFDWAKPDHSEDFLEPRDLLKSFQCLVSRTERLGIKLETFESCRRLEMHLDDDNLWPVFGLFRTFTYLDSRTLSLYYEDDTSTWVIWNSMYEEYCGEFWALLENPGSTIPGAWVED